MTYNEENNSNHILTTFITGFGLGVLATFLISDPQKQKAKKHLKKKTQQIKDIFDENWEQSQKKVKKIFGKTTDKLQLVYYKTKQNLINNLGTLQGEVGDISKDKYKIVVRALIDDLKKDKTLSTDHLQALQDFLVRDYQRIKSKTSSK